MNRPKLHHYIPRFYLLNFCREELVWVYDRKRDSFRNQSPKRIAAENEFYTLELEEKKSPEIEYLLMEVETPINPIFKKLNNKQTISLVEKSNLGVFVSLLRTRTPDFREFINEVGEAVAEHKLKISLKDKESVKQSIREFEKETGEPSGLEVKDLLGVDLMKDYRLSFDNSVYIGQMLTIGLDLAKLICEMNWEIYHAPSKYSFITTDNPFVLVPSKNTPNAPFGVGTVGVKKIIPLTQSLCLVAGDEGSAVVHRVASGEMVRKINLWITDQSNNYLFGRDKALLESLVKKKKIDKRPQGKRIQKRK